MKRSFDRTKLWVDAVAAASVEIRPCTPNITWQHVWPLNETRDSLSESVFGTIPNEILLRIFRLLSIPDLCSISSVCRLFKMIADQDEIWKLNCNTSTKLYSKSFKQIYMVWTHKKCLQNIKLCTKSPWYITAFMTFSVPEYPTRPAGQHSFESVGGFKQHPNSSSTMTITLSVDIDNTARELIKFLEKSSEFQNQWQQSPILKQMITRYYRFMQLKAFHPQNLLIPTLDIEFIWQTHLLRPEIYQADCFRLFRRIIDHSLLINDIEQLLKEQAFRDTCQLYEQRFGEHYCSLPPTDEKKEVPSIVNNYSSFLEVETGPSYSYWDKTYFEFSSRPPKDYENPFSFTETDIIMNVNWLEMCKQFMCDAFKKVPFRTYYHIQPRNIDLGEGAMKRLKKSYERFLYMAAKYPQTDGNGFVSPTYAV